LANRGRSSQPDETHQRKGSDRAPGAEGDRRAARDQEAVRQWEKVQSESYTKITYDDYAELPTGLGLTTISGLTMLMQDNKDRLAFAKLSKS